MSMSASSLPALAPKGIDLEQMLEHRVLQDHVEMLGPVKHEEVRDVMVRG